MSVGRFRRTSCRCGGRYPSLLLLLLQHMHLFTSYGRILLAQEKKERINEQHPFQTLQVATRAAAEATDRRCSSSSATGRILSSAAGALLVWTRAGAGRPSCASGGKKYLDGVLAKRGAVARCASLVTGAADGNQELQSVRDSLRDCYEQLECFLMPHPGTDVRGCEFAPGCVMPARWLRTRSLTAVLWPCARSSAHTSRRWRPTCSACVH